MKSSENFIFSNTVFSYSLDATIPQYSFSLLPICKNSLAQKPWNIKIDENRKPKITITLPAYNEAKFITQRLDTYTSKTIQKNL